MKSKHFDTIIADDIVKVTSINPTEESAKMAKQIEKWANYALKEHWSDFVDALTYTTQWVNDPLLPNLDYEAAKDLIREVVSGQDPEAPLP